MRARQRLRLDASLALVVHLAERGQIRVETRELADAVAVIRGARAGVRRRRDARPAVVHLLPGARVRVLDPAVAVVIFATAGEHVLVEAVDLPLARRGTRARERRLWHALHAVERLAFGARVINPEAVPAVVEALAGSVQVRVVSVRAAAARTLPLGPRRTPVLRGRDAGVAVEDPLRRALAGEALAGVAVVVPAAEGSVSSSTALDKFIQLTVE